MTGDILTKEEFREKVLEELSRKKHMAEMAQAKKNKRKKGGFTMSGGTDTKQLREEIYDSLVEASVELGLANEDENGKVAIYKDGFLLRVGEQYFQVKVTAKKKLPANDTLVRTV